MDLHVSDFRIQGKSFGFVRFREAPSQKWGPFPRKYMRLRISQEGRSCC